MAKSTPLFDLIKSLNQVEKRNFKIYSQREKGSAGKNYLELFDRIAALELYDEAALQKKLSNRKYAKNLSSAKNHLYNLLLRFLRDYYGGKKDKPVDIQLQEIWNDIYILENKGLYEQAEKRLRMAEKLAKNHELEIELLKICDLRKAMGRKFTKRNVGEEQQAFSKQSGRILERLTLDQKIIVLYEKAFLVSRTQGDISAKENLQLLLNELEDNLEESELTLKASMGYHFLWSKYYAAEMDFDKSDSHLLAMAERLESNPVVFKDEQVRYLNILNNYLNQLILRADFSKFPEVLAKLNALKPKNKLIQADADQKRIYFLLQYQQYTRDFDASIQLIPDLLPLLDSPQLAFDRKLVFYFLIATAYFQKAILDRPTPDFEHLLDETGLWLDKIEAVPKFDTRLDVQCRLKILRVLICYELDQDFLLESTINAALYFVRKTDDGNFEFEKKFLNGFKRLMDKAVADRAVIVRELYEEAEKAGFAVSEIGTWLEVV